MQKDDEAPVASDMFGTRPAWLMSHRALPFQDLSDDQFEVFNYLLVLKEHPGDEVIYYGKTGDLGRDIVRRLTDGTHELIQCKRYRMNVGVGEIRVELAKLCVNIFEKRLPAIPSRVVFHVVPDLTGPAIDLISSRDQWLNECDAALESFLGHKPTSTLVDFARNWSPELNHMEQHKLTERALRFPDLVSEFFEIRLGITGSLDEIKPRLTSIEQTVVHILGIVPDQLKDQLRSVDEKLDVHGGQLRRRLVAVTVLVVAGLGAVGYVGWRQLVEHWAQEHEHVAAEADRREVGTNLLAVSTKLEEVRKQFADPDVLTGKIKSHIRKRADEEIVAARAEAPGDWRRRDEIEKRRDQALDHVQDLVETIRKGLAGKPDPIFVEAAEILDKQGVNEAIKYLERKQPSIEKQISAAKSFRDQAEQRLREAYRPKVLQADLYEANLRWDEALWIREEVARESPRWFEAQTGLGSLLYELARYGESEPHLRTAVEVAANPAEEARGLNKLAGLLLATNRLSEAEPLYRRALAIGQKSYGPDHPAVATALNNLAQLLRVTNRLSEAEPLFRRALAIDERSYGPDHPDVARELNNLALLLDATNRLNGAEPLYRRALAIDDWSYGPDHPAVAISLNNLAELLRITNRLSEAEPLFRRALAIDERSNGPDHPDVARELNNLALLLDATNRLSASEPLYRRALAIGEKSYGPDHPDVAIRLNSVAGLLYATNRLKEAEPLFRRALAIDEWSYGPDHPDVVRDLNNLAVLLRATNRQRQAKPLMARVVRVLSQFQRSTGHEHPQSRMAIENYHQMLADLKLAEPQIAALIKAAREGAEKLSPIVPEVEQLLGPAEPVADVLISLDRQYKEQGKPAAYFLKPTEPIVPHLDELLLLNGDGLNAQGVAAFSRGAHADAVVLYEAALALMADKPAQTPTKLIARMNRASALRELGLVSQARDDLVKLLPEFDRLLATESTTKGRARYHLAFCQWRLGDRAAAQRSAEESLAIYRGAPKANHVAPAIRSESEDLLTAVKVGKAPPPLVAIVAPAALEAARARYRAREELTKLPLKERAAPLLDQILGPAHSTQEILAALDRSYREQGKPAVWFLPLEEPMAPHVDQLLGPVRTVKDALDSLDRQYRAQGKPAVWFLPLNEPISPHLDELLGKPSR